MNYSKRIFPVLIALLATGMLAGCQQEESEDDSPLSAEEEEAVEVRPEVTFAVADSLPIYTYVESQGVVEAGREVVLTPRISGYVTRSNIVEGQRVQRGDTLIRFAEEELALQLREAQNSLLEAQQEYDIQKRSEDWIKTFRNQDLERNDQAVRIASGLTQAEINLERVKMNLDHTVLEAPFSGTLAAERRITEGAYVNQGTELGRLIDQRTVRVRFDVLESEISRIEPGMRTEIRAPGGVEVSGEVTSLSPVVDADSKTGEVIVEVPNRDRRIKPGMTVEGTIYVERHEGKARIPRSAILSRDGGRTLLFKLNSENSEVEWVYVTPQSQNRDWVIVDHEDIAPGDTIAIDQHFALSHLQIVDPRMGMIEEEQPSGTGGN